MKLSDLLRITEGFHRTSTIENLKDHSVTFAKDQEWFDKLLKTDKQVCTIIPRGKLFMPDSREILTRIRPIAVNDPSLVFILFHNEVNKGLPPEVNKVKRTASIDDTAIIGASGMRWQRLNGRLVKMKHMGNVVIGDNVEVGPMTTIHRGTIDSTTIGDDTKIGSNNSIGHNCIIGKEVMITTGVNIAGSAKIGDGCWIGIGANIRDNISICLKTRIAMGATVVRSITTPGTYAGCPATKIGEWDGSL